jgi:hypothetical protein
MAFSCYYSLGFSLLLLVVLVSNTFLLALNGSFQRYNVDSSFVIMPVTTRLQKRLSTCSSKELSTAISTGTRVLSESTQPSHDLNNYNSLSALPSMASSLENSSLASIISLDQASTSSVQSCISFQNSEFQIETVQLPVSNSFPVYSTFQPSFLFKMETDCDKSNSEEKVSREMMDLTQILTTLSHQITNQNQAIQDHILQNDEKFQKFLQDNDNFKREIWSEIDSLRNLFAPQPSSQPTTSISSELGTPQGSSISNASGSLGVQLAPSASSAQISNTSLVSSSPSNVDFQSQMMLMLTKSFAKLSSAISDKKDETRSEWPKFSGDSKKFHPWYLAIMAQISLPPWQSLYDSGTNDIVKTTTENGLNGKLYAKLLIALEGVALQNVVSHTHLRANGILLLQDLVQTYKPKHVPEVIAAKTSLFWGNTKCLPTESADEYYNRFQELLDELSEAEEKISVKSAM